MARPRRDRAQPASWTAGVGLASACSACASAAPASAQAWPCLAGSPLSSLGNQGPLCVQTRLPLAEGSLPGSVCSALDTQPPRIAVSRGGSPRAGCRGSATVLSAGSPNGLSPSHVEEAPGRGLELRRAPLEVRAGAPEWPEKPHEKI